MKTLIALAVWISGSAFCLASGTPTCDRAVANSDPQISFLREQVNSIPSLSKPEQAVVYKFLPILAKDFTSAIDAACGPTNDNEASPAYTAALKRALSDMDRFLATMTAIKKGAL
jgi:hypothetical protein